MACPATQITNPKGAPTAIPGGARLIRQLVDVFVTHRIMEVFYKGERVTHNRHSAPDNGWRRRLDDFL